MKTSLAAIDYSLQAAEVSVEEMASLLIIKEKAEQAKALLVVEAKEGRPALLGRLATFAQLGMWPSGKEIKKGDWAAKAQPEFVACWAFPGWSKLVITEDGRLARISLRRTRTLFYSAMIPLIATVLTEGFLLVGGSRNFDEVFLAWAHGLFLGSLICFLTENFLKRRWPDKVTKLKAVDLDSLSSDNLSLIDRADLEIKKLHQEYRQDIISAEIIQAKAERIE